MNVRKTTTLLRRTASGFRYAFFTLTHPIRGFYEMRFEGQGSLSGSCAVILLFVISMIFNAQLNGFIFNTNNVKEFNIIRQIVNVLAPIVLWCTANWSVTVLLDGEGRFKDIFMATGYALLPFAISNYLTLIATNILSGDEAAFVGIITSLGIFWTALLLFCGILTVHQFTVTRNVVSILLTVFGMAFIIFLLILLAGIFDKLFSYIQSIITEVSLR